MLLTASVHMLQLQTEKSWVRWVDEAFSKLDINGDGFISMEEILDKLPLETTDPDDDMESERFLQVSNPTSQPPSLEVQHPGCLALRTSLFLAYVAEHRLNFCTAANSLVATLKLG